MKKKQVKPEDFDWVAFDKGKIAIEVDNRDPNELDEVLSILDKKGYTWIFTPGKITDKNSYTYKSLRRESFPFYLSVDRVEPYCHKGISWSGCCTTIKETPVRIDFEEDNMNKIKRVKAKDFDSAAFKRKEFRIAIRSYKNALRTLKFLDEKGCTWGCSGTSLLDNDHMIKTLLNETLYYPVLITSGGTIQYSLVRDFMPLSNVPTVELVFEEETNNDKIVITNDGKTTTATLYSNDKKAGIGTAVCHDDDKFDIYAGAKLALERLEKNKKEAEMSDWEKFVKGKVDIRVPKKYLQNFLDRADKDMLKFAGSMEDWYLKWLKEDGDSILIGILSDNVCGRVLTQVIRHDNGDEVLYFPGMK